MVWFLKLNRYHILILVQVNQLLATSKECSQDVARLCSAQSTRHDLEILTCLNDAVSVSLFLMFLTLH